MNITETLIDKLYKVKDREIFKKVKEIDSDGELSLTFKLPSNYNSASADAIGNNIHAYLVDVTLSDWFKITNKDDAKDYLDHSVVCLDIIKRALYKRSRPNRPTYSS